MPRLVELPIHTHALHQPWAHREHDEHRRRAQAQPHHLLPGVEHREQRTKRKQRRPRPQDEHGALHGMPDAQHAMMQMLAIRMHRRLAARQASHDGENHVEQRQEQHEQRQKHRHDGRHILARVKSGGVEMAGHDDGCAGDEISQQHGSGIPHEQFRRMPVVQQESHAHAHERHVDERGNGRVAG